MTSVTAILLAAGRSRRFRSKTPKPLFKLRSKPIIIYSLQALSRHPLIREIIVAVNARNSLRIQTLIKRYQIKKVSRLVLGGRRRQDSVSNALQAVPPQAGLVLIHDAGRPFISRQLITRLIKQAKISRAVIPGVPVKATVKRATGTAKFIVEETLKREGLWEIQTPQVFSRDLLLKAYRRFGHLDVTDDAALVEKLAVKVTVVESTSDNMKITTPEDLNLAEAIACRIK